MSSAPATLRPLRWWDLDAVHALEQELFGPTAWPLEAFWGELAQPNRTLLVAQPAAGPDAPPDAGSGGGVVGYAVAVVNGADADVQTIGVSPRLQGRGVGRLLLRALLEAVRAAGATRVLLEVRADDAVAQGLYLSEGFEQVARRRGYYQPGDHDAVIMRARLAPAG